MVTTGSRRLSSKINPNNLQLNAKKKEVVDTDALLQRYKKEIAELKQKLAEREAEPVKSRRLSAREVSNSSA